MKIVNEKPPIWAEARRAFDFDEAATIFTYGGTIYNPAGFTVSEDLITHESIHERQQKGFGWFGPRSWWKRYFKDPQFRFEQELEAYQAQYKFAATQLKDRNRLNEYLMGLAYCLSGSMYGNVCGFNEAVRRIKLSTPSDNARKA